MVEKGAPTTTEFQPETVSKRANWIENAIGTTIDCGRILDIGCGVGVHATRFAGRPGTEVIGLDIDLESLRTARASYRDLDFVRAASESLPFIDSAFDSVLLIEVLEHVGDSAVTLDESNRVLRHDGMLVITAPNRGFPFLTHGFHLGRVRFDDMLGIPLPLVTYMPMALLRRIWSARCFRARELERAMALRELVVLQLAFLMPAFDPVGSMGRKMPSILRHLLQTMSRRLDFSAHAWFGISIAVQSKKG